MKSKYLYLMLLSSLLCSCEPIPYHFEINDMKENVTRIELVTCENPSPINMCVNDDTVLYFNFNNRNVIKELGQNKIENFINDLSKVSLFKENRSVNSPVGYATLLYMQNNEVIVLSCTNLDDVKYSMVAAFSDTGTYIRHIAEFDGARQFRRLLIEYFDIR